MDLLETEETEETVTAGLIGYQKMTNEFIGQEHWEQLDAMVYW